MLHAARTPLATLFVVAAVFVAGCGGDDSDRPATNQDTRSTSTTSSVPETENSGAAECSASGLELELPMQDGLPEPVASTREALFDAATSCDYDALAKIAAKNPDFGFGPGSGDDPAEYWRSVDGDERVMARLAQVLTTPYVERDEGGRYYAWPSVYEDRPTSEDYADLVTSGAYTQAEADAFEREGSYLGPRVAIKPDGAWHFFTSGG